ncbi:hypothetical protein B9Z55_019307 [Caenorhabditis nigoni]|uniref:Uncharacterized protein n=1 Tax=Caenorhabditis nigoni TaxID=1611254 RepID=A0A2G5THV9_9PELO|nr:hypothetical protein B9Z55_019307 [Caenorhabditis nigoni]
MENPSCSSWKRKNRCHQIYQTTSIVLSQLFFLLLFSSFFSPTEQFGIFGPCTSATWSDWSAWSTCPVTTVIDPTIVARRTRKCDNSPLLCSGALPCEKILNHCIWNNGIRRDDDSRRCDDNRINNDGSDNGCGNHDSRHHHHHSCIGNNERLRDDD